MEKAFSHTHVTPPKKTSSLLQFGIVLGARYGGRWLFDMLEQAGHFTSRQANAATSLFSGLIAGAITFGLGRGVYHDIKNVFAETVALELNKKPHEITWGDLKKSENDLVKETLSNFTKFNVIRTGGVLGFVLGALPLPTGLTRKKQTTLSDGTVLQVGSPVQLNDARGMELGMATFVGGALGYEVMRPATIFEELSRVLEKFSTSGMGQKMGTSDLAILYQRYAHKKAPNLEFRDISDIGRWNASEILFERMAYLMEYSYRPRADVAAIAQGNAEEIRMTPQQHFDMPAFQYLLGFGLINPEKVRESLAYVEIANGYGIPAVKEVQQALSNGASLEQCFEKYPVTIPGEHLPVVAAPDKNALFELPPTHPTKPQPGFADKVGKREPLSKPIAAPGPIATHLARPETQVGKIDQQAGAQEIGR